MNMDIANEIVIYDFDEFDLLLWCIILFMIYFNYLIFDIEIEDYFNIYMINLI